MNDQLKLAEKIYKQVLDWYKPAKKKAQIMLTILNSFIVFSTGITFSNPDSFEKTLAKFDALMFIVMPGYNVYFEALFRRNMLFGDCLRYKMQVLTGTLF
ncbi:MAG: hypothetical protein KF746_21080 [Chitinophagaceae bacterium]|nr:hypothetical protein [Chitinophagaceae bacterium]